MTTSRRAVMLGAGAWLLCPRGARAAGEAIATLEAAGGRLGVAALDTETGERLGHRQDERFAMCSTFKLVLAAAVLSRVDQGELSLKERVAVRQEDLVPYAPVVEPSVGGELTLQELCEAAVVVSDNAAANLLLARTGGPEGWTQYARGLGDTVSRLDRIEPELNENLPGDPRDTTTPAASLAVLEGLLLGRSLSARSRKRLLRWMIACETGKERLRAGLPAGWKAGDKTGTSGNGQANDVAIVWPPGRGPWLIAAFYHREEGTGPERNAVLAEVGRLVTAEFGA
jgi:beta-lactamase class A